MRGSILDLVLILTFMFIVGAGSLFLLFVLDSLVEPFAVAIPGEGSNNFNAGVNNIKASLDSILVTFFFLSMVAVLITSFLVDTHPVFFVISFLVWLFIIIVSSQVANIYLEFTNVPVLASTTANFPMTIFIFQNYPLFIGVFGALIIVVLYSKIRSGGGEFSGF